MLGRAIDLIAWILLKQTAHKCPCLVIILTLYTMKWNGAISYEDEDHAERTANKHHVKSILNTDHQLLPSDRAYHRRYPHASFHPSIHPSRLIGTAPLVFPRCQRLGTRNQPLFAQAPACYPICMQAGGRELRTYDGETSDIPLSYLQWRLSH